ncbi:hypothetical protein LOC67_09285 [Stieleria sp. JC731]|uniref:hypothetical protein n=1 Tax=Pirellulaceae TaxID=2691357 RepID=UPI001E3BDBB1|nr:hypothetical protein [Stieleria sp. JC731]MCC9600756.1 hypothetical protein [Stieleria sp. JC731]
MKKQNSAADPKIAYGIVLYYFDDPGEIQRDLLEVIERYFQVYSSPFTRVSKTGDRFSKWKATDSDFDSLANQIRDHDFTRSLFLSLTNSSTKDTADQRFLFWGRRIDTAFKSKTPNYLYFELPAQTDVDVYWQLFQRSFECHPFHLGFGNFVAVADEEFMPRSGASAAKQVRNSEFFLLDFDASFRNVSFLSILENRNKLFLAHPSQFIGVGTELSSIIDEALLHSPSMTADFELVQQNGCCLFKANGMAGLREISDRFAPYYGDVSKPLMFWKPEEWSEWIVRVRGATPGRIFIPR